MQTADAHDLRDRATARGTLEAIADTHIVMSLAHTDYRLHLAPTAPITTELGKRIKGTIHARALRMYSASGGGQFIEPLVGAPRIVAGRVMHIDQANRRVLVDLAAPVWITLEKSQPADRFALGEMVNCYVESGTQFTPA